MELQFLKYCTSWFFSSRDQSMTDFSFRALNATTRSSNVVGDDGCSKRSTSGTRLKHIAVRTLGNRDLLGDCTEQHVASTVRYEHVSLTVRPILLSSSRPCFSCMSSCLLSQRQLSPCSLLSSNTHATSAWTRTSFSTRQLLSLILYLSFSFLKYPSISIRYLCFFLSVREARAIHESNEFRCGRTRVENRRN